MYLILCSPIFCVIILFLLLILQQISSITLSPVLHVRILFIFSTLFLAFLIFCTSVLLFVILHTPSDHNLNHISYSLVKFFIFCGPSPIFLIFCTFFHNFVHILYSFPNLIYTFTLS